MFNCIRFASIITTPSTDPKCNANGKSTDGMAGKPTILPISLKGMTWKGEIE